MVGGKRVMAMSWSGPPRKRFKKNVKSTSGKLKRLQRVVSALSPETKDFSFTSTVFDPTVLAGKIEYLSGCAAGTSDNQRIGKKIRVTKLRLRVTVIAMSVAAPKTHYRVFLVKDLESAGVIPTISGLPTSIFTSQVPSQSVPARENKERFKILWTWDFDQDSVNNGAWNFSNRNIELSRNDILHYTDDTAAVTGAGKNAYYIVGLSDDAVDVIRMDYAFEMDFTDL